MMKKHYKKLFIVGIITILMLATTLPAMGAPEKVRVFVEFAPGAKGKVQQALKGEGAEFHYTFDDLNSFVVSVPEAALNGLAKNPNVVDIEEDAPRYLVKSTAAQVAVETAAVWSDVTGYDGAEVMPWGVQAVQAPQVWDAGTPSTGAGVTVCIIDTGYYEEHEDLPLSAGGSAQLDAPYTSDGYGHGSHVAGTIAGVDNTIGVIGVSPDVSFYIVKYFGNDGAATSASDLIAAANDCVANGATIISMSLGGSRATNREMRAFDTHYANGILSIAAAGNDGVSDYSYPASYDSVVSVAALESNEEWADFSQFNDQVEIAAPGVDVLSTLPYIDTSIISVDGTDYQANHIEFSGRGTASGALVDGGLCDSVGSWAGMVVLCERGEISFADKVLNVASGGGNAALVYNNEPGNFLGTMDTFSSDTIGLSISQEDGQYLVANKLGVTASVSSTFTWPASGYEAWQGTSMATPHVSAVAALLWSVNPSATNVEIRDAMNATAKDLGTAGHDNYYGYGMVQAYDALIYMGGSEPVNTAPSVSITSPADGSTYDSGATVSFAGSASDTEDGDLSAAITWTSSLDGAIGTGPTASAALSDGTHTITASVEDSGGLTDVDSITVTVSSGPVNTAPSVSITSPANGSTYDSGATVSFAGSATDAEDGDLSAVITWTSSIDGAIGTGATASAALSDGTHTITASVEDSGGLTDTDSITVTVESSGGGDLVVGVTTDAASYSDRQWVTITVTVTDGSVAVSGATVTTTITTPNGTTRVYTGITGTDGTATATFKTFVRKYGSGTHTVDAVASLTGYTDGVGSTTFIVQ